MRLLVVDAAPSWRGGQNQALLTLAGAAAQGHEVRLACRGGGALAARARAIGVDAFELPFRGDLSPLALSGLWRATRLFRPQAVLLNDGHAVLPGLLAGRAGGASPIVAVRRVDFPLRSPLARAKFRACHAVIAVSRGVAAALRASGVPAERVRVVYEGVAERPAPPGGREEIVAMGFPPGALVVGNVAALTDHKDHRTLIEAARIVHDSLAEARFVVVGDGELREELQALARAKGLEGTLVFAGFRGDVDRLFPAFDVFCLSSHLEGLGTSLLDAMMFSRPIVATAAGGIPEAVTDGLNGRLVPPRDPRALAGALIDLLRDRELRERLGRSGREIYAARFTAARMVEHTLEVLEAARRP